MIDTMINDNNIVTHLRESIYGLCYYCNNSELGGAYRERIIIRDPVHFCFLCAKLYKNAKMDTLLKFKLFLSMAI